MNMLSSKREEKIIEEDDVNKIIEKMFSASSIEIIPITSDQFIDEIVTSNDGTPGSFKATWPNVFKSKELA